MSLSLTVILPVPFLINTRATLDLRRPVPLFHSPIINGSLDVQHFRLLGGMRVLCTTVHLEFLDHDVAERALGQHALDGFFQSAARVLGLHVAEIGGSDAAWISGMAIVDLVGRLGAGDAQLGCVDDDDEVTGIDVRRVNGLVFAAQTESNFAGYSSEDLVGRVNHKPLVLHVSGFCAVRRHEISLKGVGLAGPFPRSAFLFWESLRWGGAQAGEPSGAYLPRGHYSLQSPPLYED